MMANIRMAKKSRSPICRRGTMAFMMDFNTICRPRGRKGDGMELSLSTT
jgi:tartrate dehydratase alpha subunit/fumarate hydratase class I-like protein